MADILSDLKLDSATIATGLLHDTIEDTKATYNTVKKEFGKEVADLVDGVTKISQLEGKVVQNSKAENSAVFFFIPCELCCPCEPTYEFCTPFIFIEHS